MILGRSRRGCSATRSIDAWPRSPGSILRLLCRLAVPQVGMRVQARPLQRWPLRQAVHLEDGHYVRRLRGTLRRMTSSSGGVLEAWSPDFASARTNV